MSISANIHQPNICLSLTTQWLSEMIKGPEYGEIWCAKAYAAKDINSAFYREHAIMQENLTQMRQRLWIGKIVETLSMNAFTDRYPHEYIKAMDAIAPVTQHFLSGFQEKSALLRYRQLRVVREINPPSFEAIQPLILENVTSPKYYLIGFKMPGEQTKSHVIGIINARCQITVKKNQIENIFNNENGFAG